MTDCTKELFNFLPLKRKKVEVIFDGGSISSDGGSPLLRQIDHRLGLLRSVDSIIYDPRDQDQIIHSQLSLLRQRVYGIALGYEDLNDHDTLRDDIALQTSVERDDVLGSSPTLCRLENRTDRNIAVSIHEIMVDQFLDSFKKAPDEIILDFDATDDLVHGDQEGKFYHGYYRNHCFLPLYVFCGDQLLVSYLRPSNIDGAKHAWAILSLLVKKIRSQWPDVRIIFRGDGGFCRDKMINWMENNDVGYIIGIARNSRILKQFYPVMEHARIQHEISGEKQRLFYSFTYGAKKWNKKRRIIGKAEHTDKGSNPRFVVTNLKGNPRKLYDEIYCARGNMENRIKEQQLDLFADRTSAHCWWPNQFRLLLSSLAYILVERIRAIALKGTKLARATAGTIRLKLFKIGAVMIRNTRRITFHLASSYPYKNLFLLVAKRLSTM